MWLRNLLSSRPRHTQHNRVTIDIDRTAFHHAMFEGFTTRRDAFGTEVQNVVMDCVGRHVDSQFPGDLLVGFKILDCRRDQPAPESIREVVDRGGFHFSRFNVQLDLAPGNILRESDFELPSNLQWLPVQYYDRSRRFAIKHKEMKTRERHRIRVNHAYMSSQIFFRLLHDLQERHGDCEIQYLRPGTLRSGFHWWQWFACLVCGKRYFCKCFLGAIDKWTPVARAKSPSYAKGMGLYNQFLADTAEAQYKQDICHMCTDKPPNRPFRPGGFGSRVWQTYGAYIYKTAIDFDLYLRGAENRIRDQLSLPHIGEAWVSETELYRSVKDVLAGVEVVREASPIWLGRQRLDIYVPSLKLAIEYQGEQHFSPVEMFGGEEALHQTKVRDRRKRQLCEENGVNLIYFKFNESLSPTAVRERLRRTGVFDG